MRNWQAQPRGGARIGKRENWDHASCTRICKHTVDRLLDTKANWIYLWIWKEQFSINSLTANTPTEKVEECTGARLEPTTFCLQGSRDVNNRLTGWAFAHSVNYFVYPVNSTCPLPKIAHPVNYLAQRKIGTTIIKNKKFRPTFFCEIDQPQTENPNRAPQNRQYVSTVLKFVNI